VETGNASIARADATTVTFVKRDGSEQPVPTKLIRTVSVTRRGPAAVYGALIGFGVGAAITAVALLAAQPCEGAQGVCLPTDDMIAPLAFSAGLIGALLGGGFAALVGQQTTYVFDETP
jgi:hypothetical protein